MAWCMHIFMNCDLLFPAFIGTLFSIEHFQAKVYGNIFSPMVTYLALASGTKSCIYVKEEKWVRVCFWFDSVCFPQYNNSCFMSYAIMSTLFTSTTVFLANYSSGNIKANSIQPVSACLAFFEMIWHFFTSRMAFFVHLNLATLLCRPLTLQTNVLSMYVFLFILRMLYGL